jgi:hypothetical protein
MQKNGQRPISLSKLLALMKSVPEEHRIKKKLEQVAGSPVKPAPHELTCYEMLENK